MWPRIVIGMSRLRLAWQRRRLEEDTRHEIDAHIALLQERYVQRGMTPDEASAMARRQFGNTTKIREDIHDMTGVVWMEGLIQDLRCARRHMRRNPGFAAVVVSTLALGIGANTAMFSVVDAVLLRPLPFAEPERIAVLWERDDRRGLSQELVTPGSFADWRAHNSTFDAIGYSPAWPGARTFLVAAGQGHERVGGAYVSSDFLRVLGVQPTLGRMFTAQDDVENSTPVALVSERYWHRSLGGRPDVVGQPLVVDKHNRTVYTVIGVLPAHFFFPGESDIWLSAGQMGVGIPAPGSTARGGPWLEVLARLRPGVSIAHAQAEMSALARRLSQESGRDVHPEVTVRRLKDHVVGATRTALLLLFGAVTFVLLIACTNVANLMLARGVSRQRELYIRTALGAGRWRVLREMLVESVSLSLVGGAIGIVFGYWCLQTMIALGGSSIARLAEARIDGTVLAFTAMVSVLTGVAFGIAPAVRLWHGSLTTPLRDSGRSNSRGPTHQRVEQALVMSEVALSVVLVLGAALLVQSLTRLLDVSPGFRTDQALVVTLDLSSTTFDRDGTAGRRAAMREILNRVRQIPGVHAAGASSLIPLARGGWDDRPGAGWSNQPFLLEHETRDSMAMSSTADPRVVTPDFFRAMGIPLRAGRVFAENDGVDAPKVLIVNEAFARRYFEDQHENPLGQRLVFGGGEKVQIDAQTKQPEWRQIVGIVGNVRSAGLHAAPRPEIYLPYDQVPWEEVALVIHAPGDLEGLAATVRREILASGQPLTITRSQQIEEVVGESVAAPYFRTLLLAIFAAVALLLAAVGIYATMSHAVAQRTREIGIRMALGAARPTVLWQVLRGALVLTGIGAAIGLAVAFLLRHTIAALLFGISVMDVSTVSVVTMTLAVVALIASLAPSLRATRVDPLVALRSE